MSASENNTGGDLRDLRVAALRYDASRDAAPVVVAAGAGFVAQKIVEIADECGITVYHDDSAATLLSKLELGQNIPPELYQLIVDIYMTIINAANAAKAAGLQTSPVPNITRAENRE